MSVKNKSAESEHTEEVEEDGSGTIRHVNKNIGKGSDSDQIGSVPKTFEASLVFERERSDSIVKVSNRDGPDL